MSDNKARCLCLVDTINSFIVLHASIFILNSSKKISSSHFGLMNFIGQWVSIC